MSAELAIRGAPGLICFALKITRICFRRAEAQALAAGSSVQRDFRLIDVVRVSDAEATGRWRVPRLWPALANVTQM